MTITSPGSQFNQLSSVSCTSSRFCGTVGAFDNNGMDQVLADRWNGHVWKPEATVEPGNSRDSALSGVSCARSRFCAGVGFWFNGTLDRSLAENWDPAFEAAATSFPDYSGAEDNQLNGVSCTGRAFCIAVGNYDDTVTNVLNNAADRWDGSRWRKLAVPNVSGQNNVPQDNNLSAVSCTRPGFCMAVGSLGATLSQSLAERWNGTRWTTVPIPDLNAPSALTSVSCTSGSFCMAAGYSGAVVNRQPLMLSWNGTSWSSVTVPDPGNAQLAAVTCISNVFCIAVGGFGSAGALAERWNGVSWTRVPAASPGTDANFLFGVSCGNARFCMAVGFKNYGLNDHVLTEGWNGSRFKGVAAPTPRTQSLLAGVSCTSGKFCAAVGTYDTTANIGQSLTEEWNGSRWIRLSSPDTGSTEDNGLSSVRCTSSTFCMADGSHSGPVGGIFQNLTENWSA